MRWSVFIVLAVVVVALQCTVAPRVAVFGARPDWVLVLVVFYALHAPSQRSFVSGWVAGALCDLMTIERFGLISASYGLTAWLVGRFREMLFLRHPLTHFVVTFVAALAVQMMWLLYRMMMDIPGSGGSAIALSCLYTACWGPPAHWLLMKWPGFLGLRVIGRGYARAAGT